MKMVSSITYIPCSYCKSKNGSSEIKNTYIFRMNKILEKQKMKPIKTSKVIMKTNIKVTIVTQFYIKVESFEKKSIINGNVLKKIMSTMVPLYLWDIYSKPPVDA